jgi:hypothetical protein
MEIASLSSVFLNGESSNSAARNLAQPGRNLSEWFLNPQATTPDISKA